MEITLQVPDKLKRKLRALLALTDDTLGDFDTFILSQIEKIVDAQIIAEIREDSPATQVFSQAQKWKGGPALDNDGATLSYEEIEDDTPEKPLAVSREMLQRDLEVEDPEKEAVSQDNEDVTFEDILGLSQLSAEDISDEDMDNEFRNAFQNIPDVTGYIPPRSNVKKLPDNCKATVYSLSVDAKSSIEKER